MIPVWRMEGGETSEGAIAPDAGPGDREEKAGLGGTEVEASLLGDLADRRAWGDDVRASHFSGVRCWSSPRDKEWGGDVGWGRRSSEFSRLS